MIIDKRLNKKKDHIHMLISCQIFLLSNKNSVNEFCLNESLKWHRAYSVKFVYLSGCEKQRGGSPQHL